MSAARLLEQNGTWTAAPDSFKRLLGARRSEPNDHCANAVRSQARLSAGNQMPPIHDRFTCIGGVARNLSVRHGRRLTCLDRCAAAWVRTQGGQREAHRSQPKGEVVNGSWALIGKLQGKRGGTHGETAADDALDRTDVVLTGKQHPET